VAAVAVVEVAVPLAQQAAAAGQQVQPSTAAQASPARKSQQQAADVATSLKRLSSKPKNGPPIWWAVLV